MTTTICFDLDDTVVHYPEPYRNIIRRAVEAHGIEYTDELRAVSKDVFYAAFEALEPEPYRQSMAAVVEVAGADVDLDALVETLRETEYASTTVPDAARDSLTALAEDNQLA
ncbi:MAG: HAD family hydrolase, partial [Haloarcula sp.]